MDNALIIGMWQLYLKYNLSSFFYCYNVKNTHLSVTLKLQPFSIDIIVYEYTGVKKFEQITRQFLVEDPWWMSPFISPRHREGRLGARKVTPPTIWIQVEHWEKRQRWEVKIGMQAPKWLCNDKDLKGYKLPCAIWGTY